MGRGKKPVCDPMKRLTSENGYCIQISTVVLPVDIIMLLGAEHTRSDTDDDPSVMRRHGL